MSQNLVESVCEFKKSRQMDGQAEIDKIDCYNPFRQSKVFYKLKLISNKRLQCYLEYPHPN